jgi:CPA2 family monovalent cation:H+ antiporter-2
MHETDLILTLAGALTAALAFGYVTQRLGLSPIVGYLLAGVVVGPYTPGFVATAGFAEQLSEVGVVLLMFGVGLQFHLDELLAVRRVAIPGAVAGMLVSTALGTAAAQAFGWPMTAAVVFGFTLSVTSTVVLVRVLSDSRQLHSSAGHIAIGWLVMEDMLTVIVLVLLPSLATGAPTVTGAAQAIAVTLAKIAALIAFAAIVGQRVVPKVLDHVAATRSRELFTLTVLALALGIAAGSAATFGVSMALGAFLAGMVVGRSDYSLRAAMDALPMRDAFAVIFFVSVGMLLDPGSLPANAGLTVTALVVVLAGKPLVAALLLRVLRYPSRTSVTVAASLGQIGEFSFILAALARQLGVLPASATNIIVAVSIGSIVLSPLVLKSAYAAAAAFGRRRGRATAAIGEPDIAEGAVSSIEPEDRAVVIGYGPTGRTATRLLRDNGIAPTVIELNMDTVRELRQAGISAVYGDGRDPDTLIISGIRHADTLIASGSDIATHEAIRAARDLNADVHVFARAAYLRDVAPLVAAGAEQVFSGEGEVALAMTEAVLRRLGATPDQVDRERARVRRELFSAALESAPVQPASNVSG